ncbi:hypothetical protein MAR_031024 [Mya arenaria]|uniref:Uncharacterized protein n=1 Tax=Mya arenaria TaxID=6604 RepID=A0ABY7F2P4_MYAAR|nr:hypothetical protein MAR_031024 [Mya arenaria]
MDIGVTRVMKNVDLTVQIVTGGVVNAILALMDIGEKIATGNVDIGVKHATYGLAVQRVTWAFTAPYARTTVDTFVKCVHNALLIANLALALQTALLVRKVDLAMYVSISVTNTVFMGNNCKQEDGVCVTCKLGYFGEHCKNICQESCRSCDKNGLCSECKPAYFPHNNGQCETCNSKSVANNCDSSSGRCIQGCYDGNWNRTCDTECDAACFARNQTDGSCLQCKNKTRYGPDCRQECSYTCKSSVCEVNGSCINGCIVNTFGKQCENKCGDYCLRKDNQTSCSEKMGLCLYGCRTGYTEKLCPQDEEPATLSAALGGGLGGGILGLIIITMAVMWLLLRIDYDTNLCGIELNDLQYETLQERDDHRMNKTTDYSNVSERENGNMTYENVSGGPLS